MNANKENPTILIVESEALIAADLDSRLKGLGYTICGNPTLADKALDLIEVHQPNLIMMDIVLEGKMDGIEAAKIIGDRWGIPVVFLAAVADIGRLERAELTYPFGYLLKQFQDRDLRITVEMALYVAKVDGDRRKTEEALRESEARYRQSVENSPNPIFSVNTERIIQTWNKSCERLLGYDREIIGQELKTLFPAPEERLKVEAIFSRVITNESVDNVELTYMSKYGDLLYTVSRAYPVLDSEGQVESCVFANTDITERMRADQALRESEEMLRALFETAKDSIFIKDKDLRILFKFTGSIGNVYLKA